MAIITDEKEHTIEFVCSIYKVQTLVDGGIRITIDLPETAIVAAGALMQAQANGIAFDAQLVAKQS